MINRDEFAETIHNIPTPFHYISHARSVLTKHNFIEISEDKLSDATGNFFVVRDNRAICAVKMGNTDHAVILSAHNDSPCFKLKPGCQCSTSNGFKQARVASYGGLTASTWVDRDLRIAGRAIIKNSDGNGISEQLFSTNYPVGHIPSLAVHLSSKSDLAPKFNIENHFNPIIYDSLDEIISKELGVDKSLIVDMEVFFVDAQKPSFVGTDQSLLCSPRIDNLSSAITSLNAFLTAESKYVQILVVFDNEEVGSATRCGAGSNFLPTVLKSICDDDYFPKNCIFFSCDTCHAFHPNHPNLTIDGSPHLGDGPVISYDPILMFSSEMKTCAIVKEIAKNAGIKINQTCDPNNARGGMTFGPMVSTPLGMPSIDLGVPVLAMHSIRETCNFDDIQALQKLLIEIIQNIDNYY
ncbi:putative M18 family aminopeptidase 2 [Tritrichomonas foetus]|uniref:aspartyl aminopeptidase n=1 Tax=Tritrichomonas foetus TaxID=1144522 RepID=A0A1J4KHM4_9EUKA|nr:putative M18 family aminopeptidase 2 [Tritrichomonas foetus]|eukprot:OHT09158.1 putative M18 family aminopeptidase 2 [Tritrichomonas foetus]